MKKYILVLPLIFLSQLVQAARCGAGGDEPLPNIDPASGSTSRPLATPEDPSRESLIPSITVPATTVIETTTLNSLFEALRLSTEAHLSAARSFNAATAALERLRSSILTAQTPSTVVINTYSSQPATHTSDSDRAWVMGP